jgi:predicted DNA-binding protein with PD1-like motif
MSLLKWFASPTAGVVIASLGQGDLLLESIREVARAGDVHTGVVMTGLGSLGRARIHWVATNVVPPRDELVELEGPLEVVGFSGIIAAYEPHVHIALRDAQGRFFGGHLEEGCSILTLSELSILRIPDVKLARKLRDGSAIKLLDEEGRR